MTTIVNQLPTLYHVDKNGKQRQWTVYIDGNTTYKEYGLVGGKLIVTEPRAFVAKNTGKTNATSDYEQARLEAERDWIKQLDKEYYVDEMDIDAINMMNAIKTAKNKVGNVNTGMEKVLRNVQNNPTEQSDRVSQINQSGIGSTSSTASIASTSTRKILSNQKLEGYECPFKPMHCKIWEDLSANTKKKYFPFEKGVYVQPKLDGMRVYVSMVDGHIVLTSRQGKQFGHFAELRKRAKELFDVINFTEKGNNFVLDCEFYVHNLSATLELSKGKKEYSHTPNDEEMILEAKFNAIQSICGISRTDSHPLENEMQFWVFDIADPTGALDQEERFRRRDCIFEVVDKLQLNDLFVKVPTHEVFSEEEVDNLHDQLAKENFEGVVVRSKAMKYVSDKRSSEMRKYKYFEDAEFVVTGVDLDPGVGTEHFTWRCVTNAGNEFNAKPMGSVELRKWYYDNYESFLGKELKVRYKAKSFETGTVPREPRAIAFRDQE